MSDRREEEMKEYCVQNQGECEVCSLVNYGRDCRNNPVETDDDLNWIATQYYSECCSDALLVMAPLAGGKEWVWACGECGKRVESPR